MLVSNLHLYSAIKSGDSEVLCNQSVKLDVAGGRK